MRRSHYHRYDDFEERHYRRRLYLDPRNGKICGVCAGLARYFDTSVVFTRCIALAGIFVIPHITVPAYFIAYLVLDKRC
ncbi:MAG: PspC domain-containing protein [Pseudomonadales bacterium]|nr:PspC domain-containing protein [Pseudomonadales bacterium]